MLSLNLETLKVSPWLVSMGKGAAVMERGDRKGWMDTMHAHTYMETAVSHINLHNWYVNDCNMIAIVKDLVMKSGIGTTDTNNLVRLTGYFISCQHKVGWFNGIYYRHCLFQALDKNDNAMTWRYSAHMPHLQHPVLTTWDISFIHSSTFP